MNLQLDVWLSIVRLMLRGGEYFPRDMLYAPRRVAPPMVANSDDRAELTQRELEVLELVSRGLQNKSIAAHLNLSEHTVKIHLHNIISKLRAHNRTEAAAWFREKLLFRDARPGNI
jgi:DNA-binding NarL/FixJ family response regulator